MANSLPVVARERSRFSCLRLVIYIVGGLCLIYYIMAYGLMRHAIETKVEQSLVSPDGRLRLELVRINMGAFTSYDWLVCVHPASRSLRYGAFGDVADPVVAVVADAKNFKMTWSGPTEIRLVGRIDAIYIEDKIPYGLTVIIHDVNEKVYKRTPDRLVE